MKSKCCDAEIIIEQETFPIGANENMCDGQYLEREICSECNKPINSEKEVKKEMKRYYFMIMVDGHIKSSSEKKAKKRIEDSIAVDMKILPDAMFSNIHLKEQE